MVRLVSKKNEVTITLYPFKKKKEKVTAVRGIDPGPHLQKTSVHSIELSLITSTHEKYSTYIYGTAQSNYNNNNIIIILINALTRKDDRP